MEREEREERVRAEKRRKEASEREGEERGGRAVCFSFRPGWQWQWQCGRGRESGAESAQVCERVDVDGVV